MTLTLLRAADRAPQPWKNGGGLTWPVAVSPEGAGLDGFDWRLSLALVESGGPFS
ncbi:HutD family protein, partial [Phenylobacterium sp.]|uniref:HutD family protein n=1 Tax=Phenylobacterium sp. TaxID=1871053 RepID=UPI002F3F2FA6